MTIREMAIRNNTTVHHIIDVLNSIELLDEESNFDMDILSYIQETVKDQLMESSEQQFFNSIR